MKRKTRWTVAVAAAAVAVGAGAVVFSRRSKKTQAPNPGPAPLDEPSEGHAARWEARRMEALAECQTGDVRSFPQALSCALHIAFPEAGVWAQPDVWAPWMQSAADRVAADLLAATGGPDGSPKAWQVRAWLLGPRAIASCSGPPTAAALCAARNMYPWADWTRPRPWQRDLVHYLSHMEPRP